MNPGRFHPVRGATSLKTNTTAPAVATSDNHLIQIDAVLFEHSWLRMFRVADPLEATTSPGGITPPTITGKDDLDSHSAPDLFTCSHESFSVAR
jgi:hypothetical protein